MKQFIILSLLIISMMYPASSTIYSTNAYGTGTYTVSGVECGDIDLRIYQMESGNYGWEARSTTYWYMERTVGWGSFTIWVNNKKVHDAVGYNASYGYNSEDSIQTYACIGYPVTTYNLPNTSVSRVANGDYIGAQSGISTWDQMQTCSSCESGKLIVTFYTGSPNKVYGSTCGIDDVELFKYVDDEYISWDTNLTNESNYYEFTIIDGGIYMMNFSDEHSYQFTCDGNDIEYNRDLCQWYKLNFLDNCANLLINASITIFRNQTEIVYQGNDNPLNLLLNNSINESDFIQIIVDTCDGAVQYNDYVTETEIDIYHPNIAWNLNVHVIDDNTEANISQAKVTRTQNCCIVGTPSGYALTQTTGHVIFTGLANSNINLTVEKTGYTTYFNNISVGTVFNCWSNGGSITIRLNSTNDSSDEGLSSGCGVYFKNTEGATTNTINDTDTYVDMYYYSYIGNATLKFQHQIYTYWYTDEEYTIINGSSGYHRILNANFSDYTNAYRGYIYNVSTECNNVQTLNVINQTYEEETHYENLTSHCWIANKVSGNQIDCRSDIKCIIYANSTNSTLLNITTNFMNGTTLVDSKILNWADFVSGSPKWYYVWYPDYEYTTGYNYTLNITGFNGYQLDTDEVWTSDITGNELTVFVKDNYNQPVGYATIFIEDWGSIATGSHNYATVTGLPDGDYQYKATKSGYISSGWATITLTEHESVTCILIALEETSVIGRKMSDEDIKSMFIPMMYILFIFMLLGAFMYANR